MNYCRKCQSDYTTPGTCNCFARVEKKDPPPSVPIRVAPWQPIPGTTTIPVPYIGDAPCQPYKPTSPFPYTIWYNSIGAVPMGSSYRLQ